MTHMMLNLTLMMPNLTLTIPHDVNVIRKYAI